MSCHNPGGDLEWEGGSSKVCILYLDYLGFVFVGDFFTHWDPMVFITIIHHHLG